IHLAGTAGQGFQAQGTAAGKQVQTVGAFHIEHQPVEQGFTEAVEGGSQPGLGAETQPTTTPLAADNANFAGAFGVAAGLFASRAGAAGFFHGGVRVTVVVTLTAWRPLSP